MKISAFLIILILLTPLTHALDDLEVLTFDQVHVNPKDFAFENLKRIEPKPSTFRIKSYAFLSNKQGDRYAMVTLQNRSGGGRTLSREHILAVRADGERIFPLSFEGDSKMVDSNSFLLYFGKNKFPLIQLVTRQ